MENKQEKLVDVKEKQTSKKRKIVPDEEKHKKGRWVIILVFVLSLFFSYVFSLQRR